MIKSLLKFNDQFSDKLLKEVIFIVKFIGVDIDIVEILFSNSKV